MRGYFAIGIEGVSKKENLGNLFRTAHGFGAAFVFAIDEQISKKKAKRNAKADTSLVARNIPLYYHDKIEGMQLPKGCKLIGVELCDEAVNLPNFRHPRTAAYILGSERLGLSPELQEKCDHIIKIPTAFSLNLATAGAIIMYDRIISRGGHERQTVPGGHIPDKPAHAHGGRFTRTPKTE
jgi:tRNA G18 (ribose-2'-O)-methylase SpoU